MHPRFTVCTCIGWRTIRQNRLLQFSTRNVYLPKKQFLNIFRGHLKLKPWKLESRAVYLTRSTVYGDVALAGQWLQRLTSLALRLSASAARDTVHPAAVMVISGERSRVHRYRGRCIYMTTLVLTVRCILSRGPAKVFVFVLFFFFLIIFGRRCARLKANISEKKKKIN